jgi:hypothetical protein
VGTINSSPSLPIDGLPEIRRACDPSILRATSLRYQPKMVSGKAAVTTSFRVLRHTGSPISPSVAPPPCKNLRHLSLLVWGPRCQAEKRATSDSPLHPLYGLSALLSGGFAKPRAAIHGMAAPRLGRAKRSSPKVRRVASGLAARGLDGDSACPSDKARIHTEPS